MTEGARLKGACGIFHGIDFFFFFGEAIQVNSLGHPPPPPRAVYSPWGSQNKDIHEDGHRVRTEDNRQNPGRAVAAAHLQVTPSIPPGVVWG